MSDGNVTPTPGSPEHDAAMIALAERSGVNIKMTNATTGEVADLSAPAQPQSAPADAPADQPAEQPTELLAGKFKSTDELVKAYKALESKLGSQNKPAIAKPGQPQAAQEQPAEQPAEQPPALTELLEKAAAEYSESNGFAEDTVKAFEAAGIPRNVVENYVNGLVAQAQLAASKVYEAAGGETNYNSLVEWAAANWSAEQITAFNAAIQGASVEAAIGAVSTLKALYDASNGTQAAGRVEPQGGAANQPPVEMFKSKDELTAAMNDPKYLAGDPSFHAEVDRKLAASLQAGIYLGF